MHTTAPKTFGWLVPVLLLILCAAAEVSCYPLQVPRCDGRHHAECQRPTWLPCNLTSCPAQDTPIDLEKEISHSYDIVYSACGTARKSEFLLSLKSLQLMAVSTTASENALYRVHIITGMLKTITLCSSAQCQTTMWGLICAELMPECHGAAFRYMLCADGGLKKEDLQGLQKSSIFVFILHSPNPIAAPLFAPCSTQRLYLHEHADFGGIGDVSPYSPEAIEHSQWVIPGTIQALRHFQ